MSSRTVTVLVCDWCGGEDLVNTHSLMVDAHAVEAEACDACWEKHILVPFAALARVGRPVKSMRVRKADILPFPGQSWQFTSHALVRMGERHLSPADVALAADEPDVTHPGTKKGTEVRIKGKVKVVIEVRKRLVLTAGDREESLAS